MPSKPDSLRGREVVLVGGTGGLGSVVANSLLAEGAILVISYRANRPDSSWPDGAVVVQTDLSSPGDRTRLLEAAPSLYGLVVMAGDPARCTDPALLDAAMFRSYETNFAGPIAMARAAAARMRAAETPGAIVLVSTMQANALFPGSTAYASQKVALQHAARILAKECRGSANIRVNVVSPGVTSAGMAASSVASGKYDVFLKNGTIPRYGHPDDVARAVRFFLEPDNYVTGQVLCVDGGMTL